MRNIITATTAVIGVGVLSLSWSAKGHADRVGVHRAVRR